ncbi:MAG: transporter substrate-binding domain-containing protein [Clostridia bacterium]|nr:transporter substrate-binding domain-containing protein [Clostridia bacterium]
MKKLALFLSIIFLSSTSSSCTLNLHQEQVVSKTYVVAASPQEPFSFINDEGALEGIDCELLQAIAEDQKINFEFQTMPSDEAFRAIDDGTADIAVSGIKITEDLQKNFDFTSPYLQSGIVMFTRKDNTKIKNIQDLSSQEQKKYIVAVKQNSDAQKYVNELASKYNFDIVYMHTSQEVFDSIANGDATAGFEDDVLVKYAISQNMPFQILTSKQDVRSYAMALKKDADSELMQKLDKGLRNVLNSGKYDNILKAHGLGQ